MSIKPVLHLDLFLAISSIIFQINFVTLVSIPVGIIKESKNVQEIFNSQVFTKWRRQTSTWKYKSFKAKGQAGRWGREGMAGAVTNFYLRKLLINCSEFAGIQNLCKLGRKDKHVFLLLFHFCVLFLHRADCEWNSVSWQ